MKTIIAKGDLPVEFAVPDVYFLKWTLFTARLHLPYDQLLQPHVVDAKDSTIQSSVGTQTQIYLVLEAKYLIFS
jgi:hypothetical protein